MIMNLDIIFWIGICLIIGSLLRYFYLKLKQQLLFRYYVDIATNAMIKAMRDGVPIDIILDYMDIVRSKNSDSEEAREFREKYGFVNGFTEFVEALMKYEKEIHALYKGESK